MEKIKEALNSFNKKNIIVLGDIILDKFCWGGIKKLNPEQPAAPNVNIEYETYTLGGAANTANNIVALGGNCKLYGVIGEDGSCKKIKSLCQKAGISLIYFQNADVTLVKQRIMAHGQQVARLNHGEKNRHYLNEETKKKLIAKLKEDIKETDFLILSDYNKKFFDEELSQEIIAIATENKIPSLVDPKPENINFFRGCTIIRPNKSEASKITEINYSNEKDALEKIGKKLLDITNSKYAVITCGEDGVFVYEKECDEFVMMNTKARKIAEVSGAGDTFAATLALGFCSGLDIFDASRIANYASGNVVEKIGVATTTQEEILQRIEEEKV